MNSPRTAGRTSQAEHRRPRRRMPFVVGCVVGVMAVALAACSSNSATSASTTSTTAKATATTGGAATKSPYVIHVVNATTGAAAAPGGQNKVALNGYAKYVNEHGGIDGHPVQFQFNDNQSTPQTAVSLASPFIAQHVPILFNGGIGATDVAVDALATSTGPVIFDMSPVAALKKGGYVFGSAGSAITQWLLFLNYATAVGWKKVALLNATDTSGITVANALLTAFKDNKYPSLTLVDHEQYSPTDVSVTTQVQKIAAAHPQVILVPETGGNIEVALKALQQTPSLVTIPIVGTTPDITTGLLHHFGSIVPKHFLTIGQENLAGPSVTNLKLMKLTQTEISTIKNFFQYTTGTKASSGSYQLAWTAASVAVDALKHLGTNATSSQIKNFISHLTTYPGAGGMMNYVKNPQRGLGPTSIIVIEWDTATQQAVPVSGPGGKPISHGTIISNAG